MKYQTAIGILNDRLRPTTAAAVIADLKSGECTDDAAMLVNDLTHGLNANVGKDDAKRLIAAEEATL